MNKFSLVAILFLMSNSLFAQKLLKGKVTDQSGQPIVGATVLIHQNQSGTITLADGSYQIALPGNLKSLMVEFSFIGFRPKLQSISPLEGENILDVSLIESPLELQEITLTAGFVKEKELLPYAISTVMKKDLISNGGVNLAQALARNPGVYFSSFGNGVGKPVIRGLTNANVIMLNNGAKLENFNFSSSHPFLVDEFTADRIEIMKGPASLQYGSDAVGGVVNVIRERPAQAQSISGEFISHYNNNTNGYMNSLGIKASGKTFFFGTRGSIKSHKDFTDGNGDIVKNTRFNENNLSANAGARTNIGIFSLNYNYTDAQYGLQNQNTIDLFGNSTAIPILTTDRRNQVWFQDLANHLFSSNNTLFLGKNSIEVDLAYQRNTRQANGGSLNEQGQLLIPTFASMQLNTFTYNAKMVMPAENRKLVFGINGATVQNEADETKPNNPLLDSDINDFGIYAIGDFTLSNKLTLTSGLRYDYRNMESFPTPTQTTDRFKVDNTYNVVNGSVGFTYNLATSQFVKANISKGFRSPTIPELTQQGIHAGRYERGNPDLKAQDNFQFDLNYHYHNTWLTFDISPFYNIINNYTYLVTTSQDAPIGGGKIFQHVQNNANLYGSEFALDIHPLEWLGMHGSYSLIRADITDGAEGIKYPTFIPQDRITGEIKLEQEKLGFLTRPFLIFEVMQFLEQSRTGQNEAVTPAYTLLNARIGTKIALGGQDLDVFVMGNNLTNTTYVDHLSVTKQLDLNMMGKNVMFGLRLSFNFENGLK
ncbi:MAG: TonB-dependent receptor [Cyclobacteriaceae bacterium]